MFIPNLISQQTWTKKEIAKKNCLTLIVKNVNLTYSQSEVIDALKKLIGERNVVCIYFPQGNKEKDQHDRICNLEVINPVVYKQYVCKLPKILHMYTKFTLHPRSLDDTNPPTKEMLREFGFYEVNTALANALTGITNSGVANTSKPTSLGVTLKQVTTLITEAKGEMKEYSAQMKDEAIIETHTYTDIVTRDLKDGLIGFKVVGLKMSDQEDIWGDPKGKSISRGEKQRMEAEATGPRFSGASGSNNDGTKPSEECKAALFQALYEWFKEMPFTNLNRNYLALGANVGKEVFMGCMRRLFEDAISGEEWDEEKQNANYSKWMEDKLVDVLYNLQPVLNRYMKLQTVPMNNEELAAFRNKVVHFYDIMKNWSKKSQKSSATWQ
jgi:hypothetical protein